MSKARKFTAGVLLMMLVLSLAWSTSSAAPDDQAASADQVALAITPGPQENASQTDEQSEAPQAAVFGASLRAIWGERNFNAVVVTEKTIGGSWPPLKYFEEGTNAQYQWADITVTPDGTTHIVYATGSNIYHRSKPNGSTTWSDRHLVATDEFPNPVRMAAAPDGSVWVIWRDSNGTAVRYRRSTNGGLGWAGGDVAGQSGNMAAPDIAIGPDNVPRVMWYLRAGAANGNTAWIADWNGASWNVSTIGNQGDYVADPVVFVDSKNTVHTAYRRQSGGNWIIQHTSRAAGQGWSAPTTVRTTPGDAAYAPGLAVDSRGGVHITWSELSGAGGRDIWYSAKPDKQAFSAPVNVSENGGGWNSRSTVVTTTSGNTIVAHVFYQRGRRGQDVDEIFYRAITSDIPCPPGGAPSGPSTLPFKVYLPWVMQSC